MLIVLAAGAAAGRPVAALQAPDAEPQPESETPGVLVPAADMWGAVVDFGRDTWAVASSPARMSRTDVWVLSGVLGTAAVLAAYDERINRHVVRDRRVGVDRVLFGVGDALEPVGFQGNTNALYAGVAVLAYATGQDWLQQPAKQILYAHWIGSLGRQAVSRVLGRRRPNEGLGAYHFDPGGTSLPSGHAAVVFELAYILSHHIDRWPASAAFYGLAGTVAYQRAASDSHWASDVVIGAAWGYAVGRVVVGAEENRRLAVRAARGLSGGPGLSLSYSFRAAPWEEF